MPLKKLVVSTFHKQEAWGTENYVKNHMMISLEVIPISGQL